VRLAPMWLGEGAVERGKECPSQRGGLDPPLKLNRDRLTAEHTAERRAVTELTSSEESLFVGNRKCQVGTPCSRLDAFAVMRCARVEDTCSGSISVKIIIIVIIEK